MIIYDFRAADPARAVPGARYAGEEERQQEQDECIIS